MRSVASGSSVLTLDDDLENTYPEGTLVFLNLDPSDPGNEALMSGRPYFVYGEIPDDQDEGLYTGFYLLFEQVVKS